MSKELWDRGLAVRKEVLGAEYVERQLKTVDDFGMPMQELVTQSCWGWLWARPQLPRKLRSLVNLGMLSALNRPNEFKTHVRRSEEHTSELQSPCNLVCRLLLEKKKKKTIQDI